MVANPKKFYGGILLLAAFTAVLVTLFMPLGDGPNVMEHLDALYNSISKGSAYHIQEIKAEAEEYVGRPIALTLTMDSEELAAGAASIIRSSGAAAEAAGASLEIAGDLGGILTACLDDADDMFRNDSGRIETGYGMDGKRALFHWWTALKAMDRALKREGKFGEAKFVNSVVDKGVECAYNYYGIEPMRISEKIGLVILSLAFYVIYTIWYGYAIIFIFEGCGLRLSH